LLSSSQVNRKIPNKEQQVKKEADMDPKDNKNPKMRHIVRIADSRKSTKIAKKIENIKKVAQQSFLTEEAKKGLANFFRSLSITTDVINVLTPQTFKPILPSLI
jgi:hypothetical protein